MAGLNDVLQSSIDSLDAQQSVMQTISNNIANSNTPGYAVETANLASLPSDSIGGVGYLGTGATVQTVTEARNQFVEAQLPASFGSSSFSAAASSTLTAVSVLDPSTEGGLATAIGNFYGALTQLSQDAGDAGLRQTFVSAAQALALAFNNTSAGITTAQDGADTQIQADAVQATSLAAQIASLNGQIASQVSSGSPPNNLLDARQNAQDQLEQLTGAVPVTAGQGQVNMVLADGQALVLGSSSANVSTIADPANNDHLDVQITPPGGLTTTLPDGAVGGTIGGLISARDTTLGTTLSQVDSLAFNLGNAINAVQEAGFNEAGASTAGQPIFDLPATAPGSAAQIQVDPGILADPTQLGGASAGGGAGDGSNFNQMLLTQSAPLTPGGTDASGTLSAITTGYGSAAQLAQNTSQADTVALNNLTTLRASTSGVNTDDEMAQMSQTQQTYQAITQVISTANSMLESLISMVQSADSGA